jgi:hypothetical protein
MSVDEQWAFLDRLAVDGRIYAPQLAEFLDLLQPCQPARLESMRGRLLEKVSADLESQQVAQAGEAGSAAEPSGCQIVPAGTGMWEPSGIAGIQIRKLFVDRARGQFTALVRMDAGAVFPPHRHDAAEECFVLEGDLCVGKKVLHAGDFLRTAPGYEQLEQSTDGGCLLYLTGQIEAR